MLVVCFANFCMQAVAAAQEFGFRGSLISMVFSLNSNYNVNQIALQAAIVRL